MSRALRNRLHAVLTTFIAGGIASCVTADDAHLHFRFDPGAASTIIVQERDTSTSSTDDDITAVTSIPVVRLEPYGAEGQTRWAIQALYGSELDSSDSGNRIVTGGFALTQFIADGVSLSVDINGAGVGQGDSKDAGGVNGNVLFRWHFHRARTWSAFIDGGAGLIYTDRAVPTGASHLNFTPQAGAGLSFAVSRDVRVLTGLRWYHISNANTSSPNPGRDHLAVWLGVSMPF